MRAELNEAITRLRRAEAAARISRENVRPQVQAAIVRIERGAVVRKRG
jgi:hypothetical protein